MRITAIRHKDIDFAFKAGKYVMSHVVQYVLKVRVIQVQLEDGSVGYGEVARAPKLTIASVDALETAALAELVGEDVSALLLRADALRSDPRDLRGLAFALETAYFDRLGRVAGQPIHTLIGGRKAEAVHDYLSISGETARFVVDDTKRRFDGHRVVQIKLGVETPKDDFDCVAGVLDFLGPDHVVLADFNGALTREDAIETLRALSDPRLVWEEPCFSFEDNRAVAEATGAPVMFDQCVKTWPRLVEVCAGGFAHSVAVKPAFLGGLRMAAAARDMCVETGVSVRIDGPWCADVATTAALHVAIGAPPERLIAGCDLRQPVVIEQDWGGIRHLPGQKIAPLDTPGLGVEPPEPVFA